MKNKKVMVWILVVAGILGLFLLGGKSQIPNAQNEEIKLENESTKIENKLETTEAFYDFGTISMKNGNVSTTFNVSNSSNQDINLKSITTSCMCTVAYLLKQDGDKKGPYGMPGHGGLAPKVNEIIKTGETRNIEVVYDPNPHRPAGVGMVDRFIYLEDGEGEVLQLEIKATVTP